MSTHERAVLGLLLDEHSGLLSLEEVIRQLVQEPASSAERDTIEVAIRALAQAGLVHQLERFVFATTAAVHFAHLGAE
jgi:Fe2+ or Zn2+ uptake regulation protein